MKPDTSVLVIGGGIAGTTTAQSLVDFGIKVTLVEKSNSVGGLLKELGFVFPTNDCALCYEPLGNSFSAESVRKCQYRAALEFESNLSIACPAKVTDVKKQNGNILATIEWAPRKINPAKCIACGRCVDACPLKAISFPHPQAIPRAYWVDDIKCDPEKCKRECLEACAVDAFNLEDQGKREEHKFDTVVLATGFTENRPTTIPYGLEEYEEVITQIELANLLDTMKVKDFLSPTGTKVESTLIVLCAGSRDVRSTEICSSICCSYSLKHAIKLKELGVDVTVAFMDIRTLGNLEELYINARNAGVKFIRGRPGFIEKQLSGKMHAVLEDTRIGKVINIETDIVVLSTDLATTEPMEDVWKGINAFRVGELILNIPQITNQAKATALEIIEALQ